MYLIRRVFKVKYMNAMKAAELITQIGKRYEQAGQRSPIRVYISGGTVPGPADTVYMDWTTDTLESPFREGNVQPDTSDLGGQLLEILEERHVEFYELYHPR